VALAVLDLVDEQFPVDEDALRRGLRAVRWPGRLEVMLERPTVILDGAHNTEGVRALIDEIKDLRQGRKVKLLFATMADKEWQLMIRALATTVDEIVFTRVRMERSADPEQLARSLAEPKPCRVINDSRTALQTLLKEASAEEIVLVAGSLYLLGEVRPMIAELAAASASATSQR
jgi:dihydrofolate synthase/folylpolyglutamate synthase